MGFWKSIVAGMLADFTGSPTLRGREGEHLVSSVLEHLPGGDYTVCKDLLLPTGQDGDITQIDHAVFSRFGIFVIEVKNYSGWIFGDAKSRRWTRIRFRQKNSFQNPLHQNFQHIKAVEKITGLPGGVFHNIVVFTGDAEFKTPTPSGVITHPGDLKRLIPAHQSPLLSELQVKNAVAVVLAKTRQFDPAAKDEHIRRLQAKHRR